MAARALILIVDDEPFNVDYLEQELEDLGYETISAGSGREALEKVADTLPDLILLDVIMPDVDGFTVCRMLKEDRKTRLIPVVIMTSLNATEDRVEGIEAGADDFLSKPVDPRELIARIRTALKRKEAVEDEISEVRKVSDHLAKFVPDAVRRIVAANPDAPELQKREQDVSVLFVDISGYSRLSELMAPEVLNMLVEKYFSAFLDRIHDGGGEVSETAGDGMMAIFEDNDPDRHAVNAVDAALALLAENEALNKDNTVQPLAIHIGINSSPALMGSTRFEGRRGVRWVFTADGPVTNLSARLADVAKEGEIVAGPETVRRLAERYPLQSLGHEALKNIAEPVEIFQILGPPTAKPDRAPEESGRREAANGVRRRLATVLACELAVGDDESQPFRAFVDGLLTEHRDRMIERGEAGFVAEWSGPLSALKAALAIRSEFAARSGIGLGHVMIEAGRIVGAGVELATQLKELAGPGEIYVTDIVRDNAGQEIGDIFEDKGEQNFTGQSRSIRVFGLLSTPAGTAPGIAT